MEIKEHSGRLGMYEDVNLAVENLESLFHIIKEEEELALTFAVTQQVESSRLKSFRIDSIGFQMK